MNNPLAQKYNYYLNESHRLNEELKSEEEYSELLENVLFDLLGEEDFTKLFEYVMQGTVTHDASGKPLSPAKSARRADRIGKIVALGRKAAANTNDKAAFDLAGRATDSLIAKGATADQNQNSRGNDVFKALETGGKIRIQHDNPKSSKDDIRQHSDLDQKQRSSLRRNTIKREKDEAKNTF